MPTTAKDPRGVAIGVSVLPLALAGVVTAALIGLVTPPGIGRVALPITAFLAVMLGNAFSGMTTAPELMPEAARTIGQLMPPGAGGQLLRSTAFFDGAGGTPHLAVLAVWALAGVALIALGERRTRAIGSAR